MFDHFLLYVQFDFKSCGRDLGHCQLRNSYPHSYECVCVCCVCVCTYMAESIHIHMEINAYHLYVGLCSL